MYLPPVLKDASLFGLSLEDAPPNGFIKRTADGTGYEWGTAPDAHFVHDQNIPASTWLVEHNLGKEPSLRIVDSAGSEWDVATEIVTPNQSLRVLWGFVTTGKVICN